MNALFRSDFLLNRLDFNTDLFVYSDNRDFSLQTMVSFVLNTPVVMTYDPIEVPVECATLETEQPAPSEPASVELSVEAYEVVYQTSSQNPSVVEPNPAVLDDTLVAMTKKDKQQLLAQSPIPKPYDVHESLAVKTLVERGKIRPLFVHDWRGPMLKKILRWYSKARGNSGLAQDILRYKDPAKELLSNLAVSYMEPQKSLPALEIVPPSESTDLALSASLNDLTETPPRFTVLNDDRADSVAKLISDKFLERNSSNGDPPDLVLSEVRSSDGSDYIVDCSTRPSCFSRHGRDAIDIPWANYMNVGQIEGATHIFTFTGPNYDSSLLTELLELSRRFVIRVFPPPNLMDPYCFVSFCRGNMGNSLVDFIGRIRVEMLRYASVMKMKHRFTLPLFSGRHWARSELGVIYNGALIDPLDGFQEIDLGGHVPCELIGSNQAARPLGDSRLKRRSRGYTFIPMVEEPPAPVRGGGRPPTVRRFNVRTWMQDAYNYASDKAGGTRRKDN
jgi:hypothetical protein